MGQFAARSGSGALPPRLTLARLGAALAASALLHAGMLGSLGQLIGGAAGFHPGPRPLAGLRATLAPQPVPEPGPGNAAASRKASELAAAGALPLFAGPRYFTAAELDRRPAPVSEIELEYPLMGRPRDGHVVAHILINERGRADKVRILASGPADAFERLVIEAFAAALYRPGMRNGLPVKSQMTVEVKFVAENAPGETLQEAPPPAEPR